MSRLVATGGEPRSIETVDVVSLIPRGEKEAKRSKRFVGGISPHPVVVG